MLEDVAATYLLAEAKRHDPDRYLCALFAPADRRDALLTLVVFDHELARIPEIVSQPMAGMIRLQWWREALDELVAGRAARRHPVVLALERLLITGFVGPEALTALIDAREPALEGIPGDMTAVESYAQQTSGSLQGIIYKVLGGDHPIEMRAATQIGTGYGLARLAHALSGEARQWREPILARAAEFLRSGRMLAGRPARRYMAAFLTGTLADAYLAQAHRSPASGRARPAMMPLWLAARWITRRP